MLHRALKQVPLAETGISVCLIAGTGLRCCDYAKGDSGLIVLLLAGCGKSASDRKVDAIVARLDAIEQKMYKNQLDIEKDIAGAENDISDLSVHAAPQKQ
jgi:hypothetical protein